jgi:hypothetical protein
MKSRLAGVNPENMAKLRPDKQANNHSDRYDVLFAGK